MGFALVFVLLGVTCGRTLWHQLENGYSFEDYTREFQKRYASPAERAQRQSIFEGRLATILAHNRGSSSWKQGVNRFTDRTTEELQKVFGLDKALAREYDERDQPTMAFSRSRALPTSVDWTTKGIVTPVKDQGECGSCWTFATSEVVESYWALATGQLATLAPQQIASCTANPLDCGGSGGCEGGITQTAFESIIAHGGLASEWTYPYISYQGRDFNCLFNNQTTVPVARLKGYHKLPSNENTPVLNALQQGPLAINVDASTWHSYESGVYSGCSTTDMDINHVVVLEGYGVDSATGEAYWLVRNSWSPSWGENGYIRLARLDTPSCGYDDTPTDGTGCVGGRQNVTVCGTCGLLYSVTYPVIAA